MPRPPALRMADSRSASAISPPPSPVLSTTVSLRRASVAPGTLGQPRPIDWKAVPTITIRSGCAIGQYMFAQPMK